MSNQTIGLLTGITLSISIGIGVVSPALAGSVSDQPREATLIGQVMGDPMRGTIKMIRNDVVTIDMPNGESRQIDIPKLEQEKLGLLPGTEILIYPDGMVALYQPMSEAEQTASASTDEIRRIFDEIRSRQERTTTVTTPVRTQPAATPRPEPVRVEQPASQPVRVEQPASQQPVRALW